jgi:hypothetical protein
MRPACPLRRLPLPAVLLVTALLACDPGAGSRSAPSPSGPSTAREPTSAGPAPGASGTAGASPSGSAKVEQGESVGTESWLARTLRASDPRWADWLAAAKPLRIEILVTAIEPESQHPTSHELRVDEEYFYPASAVKPFIAVAALRAMGQRAGKEIPLATRILRCRDDRPDCEPPEVDEEKAEPGGAAGAEPASPKKKHEKLRVGEEVTKLLSYSDNDSYNRLFDIVGQRELNLEMAAIGFPAVRFHHRMDAPAERSRSTLRTLLLVPGGKTIEIPRRKSDFELAPTPAPDRLIGQAHYADGKRVEAPMSFDRKNYASVRDLHRLLQALVLPERFSGGALGLSDGQRELLVRAMTARLAAARHAAEHNPLSPGVLEVLPAERLRYVGKSGRAYGFHLDNAFVEDTETRRGFFVTATVYANPNGVLNDDDYGYDEISRPLLASLGKALAQALLVSPHAPR